MGLKSLTSNDLYLVPRRALASTGSVTTLDGPWLGSRIREIHFGADHTLGPPSVVGDGVCTGLVVLYVRVESHAC